MVKAKRIVYNAETGEIHEEEFEFMPDEAEVILHTIDISQLIEKVNNVENKLNELIAEKKETSTLQS